MKPKNQHLQTSENDAKEKLITYVYEYLVHSGAQRAAKSFLDEINYPRDIQINPDSCNGFLAGWWFVFWDLYCAAADKKPGQPEPSSEARAFHEYSRGSAPGVSPSCLPNNSPPAGMPPGLIHAGNGPPMMGPRYGGPNPNHQMRPGHINAPGPRMHNIIPQGGPPQQQMPQMVNAPPSQPQHPGMMPSPRYAPHPGHMTPGSSAGVPVGAEPGPSPGLNRMTPNHVGSPHPQQHGPNNMPQMAGPVGGPHGGPPPPQIQQMGGPPGSIQGMQPRNGQQPPQNWQGNFGVSSPIDQQFMMPPVSSSQQGDFNRTMMMGDGGMMEVKGTNTNGPPNQPHDEYAMATPYAQQGDRPDDVLKESLENNTSKDYNDSDQTGYIEYHESQKW